MVAADASATVTLEKAARVGDRGTSTGNVPPTAGSSCSAIDDNDDLLSEKSEPRKRLRRCDGDTTASDGEGSAESFAACVRAEEEDSENAVGGVDDEVHATATGGGISLGATAAVNPGLEWMATTGIITGVTSDPIKSDGSIVLNEGVAPSKALVLTLPDALGAVAADSSVEANRESNPRRSVQARPSAVGSFSACSKAVVAKVFS